MGEWVFLHRVCHVSTVLTGCKDSVVHKGGQVTVVSMPDATKTYTMHF